MPEKKKRMIFKETLEWLTAEVFTDHVYCKVPGEYRYLVLEVIVIEGRIHIYGKTTDSFRTSPFYVPEYAFRYFSSYKSRTRDGKVKQCLDRMSEAHPFLRSVIRYESDTINLYYDIRKTSTIEIDQKASIATLWRDYRAIGAKEWNIFEHGLLKVLVYASGEDMQSLFVAHHLLGDGRCLLELVNEFTGLYVDGIEPAYAPEQLIRWIEDLPEKSDLPGISRFLVNSTNKKWRKELL